MRVVAHFRSHDIVDLYDRILPACVPCAPFSNAFIVFKCRFGQLGAGRVQLRGATSRLVRRRVHEPFRANQRHVHVFRGAVLQPRPLRSHADLRWHRRECARSSHPFLRLFPWPFAAYCPMFWNAAVYTCFLRLKRYTVP